MSRFTLCFFFHCGLNTLKVTALRKCELRVVQSSCTFVLSQRLGRRLISAHSDWIDVEQASYVPNTFPAALQIDQIEYPKCSFWECVSLLEAYALLSKILTPVGLFGIGAEIVLRSLHQPQHRFIHRFSASVSARYYFQPRSISPSRTATKMLWKRERHSRFRRGTSCE